MNPTQQGNPYDSIVQQFTNRKASQGGVGLPGGGPATPPAPAGGQGSALAQAQAGATAMGAGAQPQAPGSNTKLLLSALQALNQFASAPGNDPQEITIIRSLIAVLTELIKRDQQRAHQMTMGGQGQPQGSTAQMPPTGGGAGAGNAMPMMGR